MFTAVYLQGVASRDDYWDAQHQYRQRPQLLVREATPSLICDAHSDSKLKTISHRDYLRSCLGFAARSAIRPNCHFACIRMLLLETLKAFVRSEEPFQCSRYNMTRGAVTRVLSVRSKVTSNFGSQADRDLLIRLLVFGFNYWC
jgi:hypothetical protein